MWRGKSIRANDAQWMQSRGEYCKTTENPTAASTSLYRAYRILRLKSVMVMVSAAAGLVLWPPFFLIHPLLATSELCETYV